MPIAVVCDCGKKLNVPDQFAGKQVKCPGCGGGLKVPTAGDEDPPVARPVLKVSSKAPPASVARREAKFPTSYSVDDFIDRNGPKSTGEALFELESERLLAIHLDGEVWIKMGAMVAYDGQIKFVREGILERGIGNLFKKALSGEGTRLTRATGEGTLYTADQGKKITLLQLEDDSMFVNGNDVLAFEMSITSNTKMMRKVAGMLAGGLFNVKLEGTGLIAITSHYDPLVLHVDEDHPVVTDPNATVAWSGSLSPELKTDISLKTFFGRGSGESIQMLFEGEGFVVVQPYEEVYFQHSV